MRVTVNGRPLEGDFGAEVSVEARTRAAAAQLSENVGRGTHLLWADREHVLDDPQQEEASTIRLESCSPG